MKRLLAEGSGSIFSIGKAFREAEVGSRHNPEFSMLEWYRVGYRLEELIADVTCLLKALTPGFDAEITSYAALYEKYLGVNPHPLSDTELQSLVYKKTSCKDELDRSGCYDLLMAELIEPQLSGKAVFVIDYPECQASMAKIITDTDGNRVAHRFELYIEGVEIANGYAELTDAKEQEERLQADRQFRKKKGLAEIPFDKKFLEAMEQGLPECSGVALGLDRLLWLTHKKGTDSEMGDFILFPWRSL